MENCDYVALEAEMLRDWLIVVIKNSSLSEKLRLYPELTLEKEEKKFLQREAVYKQQEMLKTTDTPLNSETEPTLNTC